MKQRNMSEYRGTTTKCCLCGKEILTWNSKNPEPLRKLRAAANERCCEECFDKKVIPARRVMIGEKEEEKVNLTVTLSKEFELWKLERVRDSFNSESAAAYTLEEMASILLSDAIIEKEREL